jgi:hypothetical protein
MGWAYTMHGNKILIRKLHARRPHRRLWDNFKFMSWISVVEM